MGRAAVAASLQCSCPSRCSASHWPPAPHAHSVNALRRLPLAAGRTPGGPSPGRRVERLSRCGGPAVQAEGRCIALCTIFIRGLPIRARHLLGPPALAACALWGTGAWPFAEICPHAERSPRLFIKRSSVAPRRVLAEAALFPSPTWPPFCRSFRFCSLACSASPARPSSSARCRRLLPKTPRTFSVGRRCPPPLPIFTRRGRTRPSRRLAVTSVVTDVRTYQSPTPARACQSLSAFHPRANRDLISPPICLPIIQTALWPQYQVKRCRMLRV